MAAFCARIRRVNTEVAGLKRSMANRILTKTELQELFVPLIAFVRERLRDLASNDAELFWSLRRKLAKELTYDERSKPSQRRALKIKKRTQQSNLCAICRQVLPKRDCVLDRLEAMKGYTVQN